MWVAHAYDNATCLSLERSSIQPFFSSHATPTLGVIVAVGCGPPCFFLFFSFSLFPPSGTPVSDVTVLARNGGSASVKAPPTHRRPPFGWGAGNPAALPPHIKLKGPGRPSVEYCLHRRFGVVGRRPGKMLMFSEHF